MATLDVVSSKKKSEPSAEETAAKELVRQAHEQGLSLTGPDGLLKQFTKNVLETALNEEMTEHLGHEKNRASEDRDSTNVRNGTRPKTVLTEATGQVEIEVPRDRDGSFEPQIVKKRQRRLNGVDEIVLSLYAKGLTTGEISAHFAEIYGASVSKETISRITDKVVEEMTDWANRPLEGVYAAVFIDAIMVKVRDGQVANRPIYAAAGSMTGSVPSAHADVCDLPRCVREGHLASFGLLGWRRAGRQASSGVTREASAIAISASDPALLATQDLTRWPEL